MDHEFAVQEAVGLRAQPQVHLGIAAAAKTADSACRDRRPEGRRIGALRYSTGILSASTGLGGYSRRTYLTPVIFRSLRASARRVNGNEREDHAQQPKFHK